MPTPAVPSSSQSPLSFWARLVRNLRPSHQHTAFSATILLMGSVLASRLLGYLREMYIAWAFGAGHQTDAYFAAFQIPDYLNYILACFITRPRPPTSTRVTSLRTTRPERNA